ncbi:MAG: ATP-binding protein [Bacillota bacterium]
MRPAPLPARSCAASLRARCARAGHLGIAPLGTQQSRGTLDVIDDRAGTRSITVVTQLPIEHWHGTILDPTVANRI